MRWQMFAHPEREPPAERTTEMIIRNRDVSHGYHTPGKGVHRAVSRDGALVARVSEIGALTLLLHGTKDETISRKREAAEEPTSPNTSQKGTAEL